MPLSKAENDKLKAYLASKNSDLIRQPSGDVAKYQDDPHPSLNVMRSSRSRTLVPRGGEIDQALKPQAETQDASLGVPHLADGGFVYDEDPKLKDTLTQGTSTPALLDAPAVDSPTPPIASIQTDPRSEDEKDDEKVQDSHPGHTSDDLSDFIKGQESQASKYGPEEEKAVLDSILKERGGMGRNIGRGLAAFTDTAGPAFGAGTGTLKNMDERENEMDKARLEQIPTLQGMNEKQMGQKMALEGMNPESALGKSTSGTLQTVMKQLFPNMTSDQLNKLTQNPTVMQKLFPDLGALLEKQNMSDLKKMEIEQGGQRLKAEEANQLAGRKLEEQKQGLEHPILKAMGKLPSVLPNASTNPEGRVSVISPTGVPGHIPASQLKAALAKGYKQQ